MVLNPGGNDGNLHGGDMQRAHDTPHGEPYVEVDVYPMVSTVGTWEYPRRIQALAAIALIPVFRKGALVLNY